MGSSRPSSAEPPRARAAAVVVAGGSGRRMGGGVRKQYLEVGGEPILLRAVRAFLRHPGIGAVVVVLPPDDAARPPAWLAEAGVVVVGGGAERGDSVWNGLLATPEEAETVLVHDGARPFVGAEVIDRVLEGARAGAVLAALPVTDTLKEVREDGTVAATPDRARFWQAQTPQGFPRAVILEAHRRARAEGVRATDDAALCERYGIPVRVVEGAAENLKVTRPADLLVAEALARRLPDR
ncbi:MAG TPA: 2-C-methyl-D-erythritol 4-phosphate cytidylyltransferase [Longimicrobiaceae bacterium]|nr:2-C-methyl-D-erythritol 4-phosphate cytidylyltransferase [Longimicrobiaceae bacterium]